MEMNANIETAKSVKEKATVAFGLALSNDYATDEQYLDACARAELERSSPEYRAARSRLKAEFRTRQEEQERKAQGEAYRSIRAGVSLDSLDQRNIDQEAADLARILRAARPGTLALGGRISEPVRKAAQAAGVELVDYFLRPELACLNAVPTAEGCLALLMQLRQRTIWESEFLVLGYGRIGRAVAQRLQALGGQVTIAARAPEQRAAARCAGLHAAPLTALEQLLPHFDAVINTIPAPVLGAAQLRCLPRGALILDLASRPGGTDFAAARELGLRAEHALSLPARCAPETAGALVAHTVEVILQERAATARSERGVS